MSKFSVKEYWNKRYDSGGNSGFGSWNEECVNFKSEYINHIIKEYNIKTVCEIGCGDGNQLKNFSGYTKYSGFDISSTAIMKCKLLYTNDNNKEFFQYLDDVFMKRYDLSLSLDVIYHLVEDDIYNNYMYNLFAISDIVCIFSSNGEQVLNASHIKTRNIKNFISDNFNAFKLIDSKIFKDNLGFFLYKKTK